LNETSQFGINLNTEYTCKIWLKIFSVQKIKFKKTLGRVKFSDWHCSKASGQRSCCPALALCLLQYNELMATWVQSSVTGQVTVYATRSTMRQRGMSVLG